MKSELGYWRVMRDCCRSGNCFRCQGALTGKGAVRIVQAQGYSEAYARHVARNWGEYKAVAEPMPVENRPLTVKEAKAMFTAIDEARTKREWRESR